MAFKIHQYKKKNAAGTTAQFPPQRQLDSRPACFWGFHHSEMGLLGAICSHSCPLSLVTNWPEESGQFLLCIWVKPSEAPWRTCQG